MLKMSTEDNILNETSGHLPAELMSTETDICNETSGHFQPSQWQQNKIFLMRHEEVFQPCLWQQKLILIRLENVPMSHIFNGTLGHFPAVLATTKWDISNET